jgi:DNA/RNA-binding protein KIN17
MNATRWVTLTEFIKHLGRSGIVRCDETDKGWFVQWVDNNPKTLARQAEIQKREKGNLDDESRARKHLKEQIERAKAQAEEEKKRSGAEEVEAGLKRAPEEGKFKLEIAPLVKKEETEASTLAAGSPSAADIKPVGISFGTLPATATKPGIVNPLKRPAPVNVFKQAKAAKTSSDTPSSTSKAMPMSAAERLMKEEEMRKQNRGSQGYAGFGPKRGG